MCPGLIDSLQVQGGGGKKEIYIRCGGGGGVHI